MLMLEGRGDAGERDYSGRCGLSRPLGSMYANERNKIVSPDLLESNPLRRTTCKDHPDLGASAQSHTKSSRKELVPSV